MGRFTAGTSDTTLSTSSSRYPVFNSSRNKGTKGSGPGGLGGIWGGALAATTSNLIFAATANGPFDASVGDWGSSYIQLQPRGSTLEVLDYFAPHQISNNDDEDLGASTGMMLAAPGSFPHELTGGGKTGTLYAVNRDAMGKFNSSSDHIIHKLAGAVGVHLSGSPTCGAKEIDCDYSAPEY